MTCTGRILTIVLINGAAMNERGGPAASQQDLRGGWFMVDDLTPPEGPVEIKSEMASTGKSRETT